MEESDVVTGVYRLHEDESRARVAACLAREEVSSSKLLRKNPRARCEEGLERWLSGAGGLRGSWLGGSGEGCGTLSPGGRLYAFRPAWVSIVLVLIISALGDKGCRRMGEMHIACYYCRQLIAASAIE